MLHIDGIIFSLQRYGGISVYFRELLSRLKRNQVPHVLSLEAPLRQSMEGFSADAFLRPARRFERYRPSRALTGVATTVFHSSYYRRPERREQPSVVTVHDFAYERCVGGPRAWLHSLQKKAAIVQAQAIICISEATRQDLLELVPLRAEQQVFVVHNGVSADFHPLPTVQGSAAGGRPFILFVGQRGRYKNFGLVLRALERLPDIELHCVGGGPPQPGEVFGLGYEALTRIKHLGFVSDTHLNELYNRALCLVYPSAYEGFGIPVIEAMRAGCPVISIDCNAVLEVGGEALTVVEPDPESIARAVIEMFGDRHRNSKRDLGFVTSKRFSWETNFEQTMTIYRALM